MARINNKKVKTIFLMAFVVVLSACNFTRVYLNREQDDKEGRKFLELFYKNIKDHSFDKIDDLSDDEFKNVIGPKSLSKLIKLVYGKVGSYKSHSVVDFRSEATEGNGVVVLYKYKLKVSYDKGTIDEIIGFAKKGDSLQTIRSYNVYSDLLIKP